MRTIHAWVVVAVLAACGGDESEAIATGRLCIQLLAEESGGGETTWTAVFRDGCEPGRPVVELDPGDALVCDGASLQARPDPSGTYYEAKGPTPAQGAAHRCTLRRAAGGAVSIEVPAALPFTVEAPAADADLPFGQDVAIAWSPVAEGQSVSAAIEGPCLGGPAAADGGDVGSLVVAGDRLVPARDGVGCAGQLRLSRTGIVRAPDAFAGGSLATRFTQRIAVRLVDGS